MPRRCTRRQVDAMESLDVVSERLASLSSLGASGQCGVLSLRAPGPLPVGLELCSARSANPAHGLKTRYPQSHTLNDLWSFFAGTPQAYATRKHSCTQQILTSAGLQRPLCAPAVTHQPHRYTNVGSCQAHPRRCATEAEWMMESRRGFERRRVILVAGRIRSMWGAVKRIMFSLMLMLEFRRCELRSGAK